MPLFGPPDVEKLLQRRDVRRLAKALSHKDYSIRERAADALRKLKERDAVPALIAALNDEDSRVRSAVVLALYRIGDHRAVERLIEVLRDDNPGVRAEAALALGAMTDPRAVKPLWGVLQSQEQDYHPRYEAREGLRKLAVVFPDAVAACALTALQGAEDDHRLREDAAELLGQARDSLAVGPLIAALDDPASIGTSYERSGTYRVRPVCEAAAEALGNLGDPRAVDSLVAALRDGTRDHTMRIKIVKALGRIGDARSVEALADALYDDGPRVAEAAASALANIKAPQATELSRVAPLLARLQDSCAEVCGSAARELGQLGDKRAIRGLIIALQVWGEKDRAGSGPEGGIGEGLESMFIVQRTVRSILEALKAIGGPEAERAVAVHFARTEEK